MVRIKFFYSKGWQRERKVFDMQKKVLSELGHLADERPDNISGYLAERPETASLKDCIRVWAPCGCCLTFMSPSASVLTQCDSEKDDFVWAEAEAALNALRTAEAAERGETGGEPGKLEIIPSPKA